MIPVERIYDRRPARFGRLVPGPDAGAMFPGSMPPERPRAGGRERPSRHFRFVSAPDGRLDYIETIARWRARFAEPSPSKYLLKARLVPRWLTSPVLPPRVHLGREREHRLLRTRAARPLPLRLREALMGGVDPGAKRMTVDVDGAGGQLSHGRRRARRPAAARHLLEPRLAARDRTAGRRRASAGRRRSPRLGFSDGRAHAGERRPFLSWPSGSSRFHDGAGRGEPLAVAGHDIGGAMAQRLLGRRVASRSIGSRWSTR